MGEYYLNPVDVSTDEIGTWIAVGSAALLILMYLAYTWESRPFSPDEVKYFGHT